MAVPTELEGVRGPVLSPGEDRYEQERDAFQTAFRHEPALIVGAADADDVCAAVAHAAAAGLPVAVQATGHGVTVPRRGGLLISTRRMTGVRIDPERREARIEAGVRWGQVVAAAARHRLAPLSGSSPDVGAVGYVLGGGFGLLAREFGFAADHVHSIDVVTGDARLRTVSAAHEPELFWAFRGGKDRLGVVTAMTVRLFPVDRIQGGGLLFDVSRAREVFAAFRNLTDHAPTTVTASLGMLRLPPVPQVPDALRGRHVLHVRLAGTCTPRAVSDLLAPLRRIRPVLRDDVREMPFSASASIYDDPRSPHAYHGDNLLLDAFPPEAAEVLRRLCGPAAPVPIVVDVRHLGGALSRPPAQPNAVGHRDARYLVRVLSPLGGVEFTDVQRVHRRVLRELAPWAVGRSVNFVYGPVHHGAWETVHEKGVRERLRQLKQQCDPQNLFGSVPLE
ncbi:FAD-binding oxidoreductase [Streptomyces sp. NPDC059454]|uniref:FAD-binding oxidoreductase n=1 Tax=Streptomyces sp. NPDC059454 TaxID=3346836 RepID=UPI0036CE5B17